MKNEDTVADVPYFVHESEIWRMERCNKRLTVVLVAFVVLAAVALAFDGR